MLQLCDSKVQAYIESVLVTVCFLPIAPPKHRHFPGMFCLKRKKKKEYDSSQELYMTSFSDG